MQTTQVLRKCVRCGMEAAFVEELKNFKPNNHSKYGYQNICKQCYNEYARNPVLTERYRKRRTRYSKQYHKNHPIPHHAQNLTKREPRAKICSCCGSDSKLERHHPDYSKPREFVTLCMICHKKLHSEVDS